MPNEQYQFRILSVKSTLYLDLLGIVGFISYIMFVIFGSAGFSFFGADMIKRYLFQPTLPKPEEHVIAKNVLKETSEKIIEKGRMVYSINDDLKQNRHRMTLIEAETKKRIMSKKISEIRIESDELKEMLEIFEKEGDFENENPLLYILYGVLGIFSYLCGIYFAINNYYLINSHFRFTDDTYYYLREYLGQGFVYIILVIVYIFIMIAILNGYAKFSQLTPDYILKEYPLIEDKTWTDDYLLASNLLMLSSFASIMALVRQFPTIFTGTGFFYTFSLNFASVYPYSIYFISFYPNVSYIIFYMVGFFIVFFESAPKEKLTKLIDEKKQDLKEKQEAIKENNDMI
jgi:hypothetical protein